MHIIVIQICVCVSFFKVGIIVFIRCLVTKRPQQYNFLDLFSLKTNLYSSSSPRSVNVIHYFARGRLAIRYIFYEFLTEPKLALSFLVPVLSDVFMVVKITDDCKVIYDCKVREELYGFINKL